MPPVKQIALILSGGGEPTGNKYSQYLQTKRISDFLHGVEGFDVTTLFASGLTPQSEQNASPDVYKIDDKTYESAFIRGEIQGNQPATLSNIFNFFKTTQISPASRFLLFVTDHGSYNWIDPSALKISPDKKSVKKDYDNNCISLWATDILLPEESCLPVSDLKKLLQSYVPSGMPINYVMTQCYSGAFHMLGYKTDEKGVPHKTGNICGFSASTKEETAAGCTAFADEDLYDGYERRIAEAITGISVLTGEAIGKKTSSLSEAHDHALLLDNTKDIPLRTSEAFVIDYWTAINGNDLKKLNRYWHDLNKDKLPLPRNKVIMDDLQRRMNLIAELRKQIGVWNLNYKKSIADADIIKISEMTIEIGNIIDTLNKKLDEIKKELEKKLEPLAAAYFNVLKLETDDESKERFEFEILDRTLRKDMAIARLIREDPTLKKLARYLDSQDDYTQTILQWANEQDDFFEQSELDAIWALKIKGETVEAEIQRLEVTKGQLQRLMYQMTAATAIIWLAINDKKQAVKDIEEFIKCENQAEITPQYMAPVTGK